MKEALERFIEAARLVLQKRRPGSMTVLLDADLIPLLNAYNRALDEVLTEEIADAQESADRVRESREGGIGR